MCSPSIQKTEGLDYTKPLEFYRYINKGDYWNANWHVKIDLNLILMVNCIDISRNVATCKTGFQTSIKLEMIHLIDVSLWLCRIFNIG